MWSSILLMELHSELQKDLHMESHMDLNLELPVSSIWSSIMELHVELHLQLHMEHQMYIYMSILGRSSSFVVKLCERQPLHRLREQLRRTWLVLLGKLVVMLLELIWIALPPNATSTGPSAF